MKLNEFQSMNYTEKRVFMLLSKQLYELAQISNKKYKVVILHERK